MPTWKKVIVSGSIAQLAAVSASSGILVGNNQQITTSPATTFLTGSFSGSFTGNGAGLTGVTATPTFPTTAVTDLTSPTAFKFFINDDPSGTSTANNKHITYGDLLVDLAGTNLVTQSNDSLTLAPQISITGATGSFTGSFFGAYSGNGSGLTAIPYSSLTSVPSGIVSASSLASSTQGQVTLTTNGVGVTTNLNSLQAADSPTFAGINANGVSFGLATATATAIQIGGSGATVTIPGNLTVNGTTTIINSTQVSVKDQFILLASGSSGNIDGGIIVQDAAATGEALYWENDGGATGRWSIASGVSPGSTTVTANSYLVTVSGSTGNPSGNPIYGGATNGIGNMYVDTSLTGTSDNNIWIWA